VPGRDGVVDSPDDDGREREHDERDEDAFDGVLDQAERLPGVD
jgi:hypothetical protein